MSSLMSVGITHLKSAQKSLTGAHAMAGKHYDQATGQAANIARRKIRAEMPRAKGLPAGSHYASGAPRKPGDMRRAVSVSYSGRDWSAKRTVHAGGSAHILIPGAKAHEIHTKTAKALSVPAGFTVKRGARNGGVIALASVHHNAIPGHPWVELGKVAAMPEIEALIAATGKTITAELAREIEGR